jgi:hypothetical protein
LDSYYFQISEGYLALIYLVYVRCGFNYLCLSKAFCDKESEKLEKRVVFRGGETKELSVQG